MRALKRSAVVVLMAACLFPASATADPIAIVLGGTVLFDTGGPPFFTLSASNGYTYVGGVTQDWPECCGPWSAGEAVGFSSTWGDTRDPYNDAVERSDGLRGFPVAHFVFSAPSLTLSPSTEAAHPSGLVMFQAPFMFSGQLAAFAAQDYTGAPLFTVTLTGTGTARLLTTVRDQGRYEFVQLEYDFESAKPVPEPATLLLFSAAGALLIRRPRRRNRVICSSFRVPAS